MSRLFAGVYLDEDVDVLIATLLKARGFEASTTFEAGNVGADDPAQLEFAAGSRQAQLTHHRVDFERWRATVLRQGKLTPV